MECLSCTVFDAWQSASLDYADQVTQQMSPIMLPFYGAVFTLFWAGRIGFYVMGADFDFASWAKDIALGCIAGTMLTFPTIWPYIIDTFRDTSIDLATWLVTIGQGTSGSGLDGLLTAIETPLISLMQGASSLVVGTSFYELSVFLSAAVLWVIYAVLWLLIVIDVIWFFTKFIVISVFGPILFVCMALPPLRGIAMQALRLLIQTVLEFGTIGIIIGLSTHILRKALSYMPLADGSVQSKAQDYVFTTDYLGAIFCGVLIIFLRGAFKHVAAQLGNAIADAAPVRQTLSDVAGALRKLRPTPKAPTPASSTN